jgi:uroporphyrinogen decarboxylase
MQNTKALDAYPWPDPDDVDYAEAAAEAKRISREFVTLGPCISLFEVYCGMRSLEEALVDTRCIRERLVNEPLLWYI